MIMFSIAPVFITLVVVLISLSVIRGFMWQRRIFGRVTDEFERAARKRSESPMSPDSRAVPDREPGDYACSHCGAGLDTDNEISPSGDFKCRYCRTWNNVNQ